MFTLRLTTQIVSTIIQLEEVPDVTSRHVYFAKNDIISCNKTAMAGQARLKALTAFRKEKKHTHKCRPYWENNYWF